MNQRLFLCLLLFGFLGAGCATVSVNSDYDTRTDFSKLRTYAWESERQPLTDNPRLNSEILDNRVRAAVDETLSGKGFQKISTGTPDFKVAYLMALEDKMDVTQVSTPYYSPYSTVSPYGVATVNANWDYHGGSETFVTQYEEGTLLIDVVDTKANALVWRGEGKKAIDENADSAKRVTNIRKAVQKILSEFPPVSRS